MDDTTIVGSSPPRPFKIDQNKIKIFLKSPLSSERTPQVQVRKSVFKKSTVSNEDRKLVAENRLLCDELNKQIGFYKKDNYQLKQAIKILKYYDEEEKVLLLIEKWRTICQAGMSFIMNSTLIKIARTGGYEELLRKEFEAAKRKLEYQVDDSFQNEMDELLESEEFQRLPEEVQQEYKDKAEEKIREAEVWKEKEFAKLENALKDKQSQEMTMKELSNRLKVEFELVFPE